VAVTNEEVYCEVRRALCEGGVEILDVEQAAADLIEWDAELWDARQEQVVDAIVRVRAENQSKPQPPSIGKIVVDALFSVAMVAVIAVAAWGAGKLIAAAIRLAWGFWQ
jgi:N-methylhydantoinase A/oxoprolinase/acetone carboxylase beta subunit